VRQRAMVHECLTKIRIGLEGLDVVRKVHRT
jgi:hypothetical protein